MYVPRAFAVDDADEIRAMVRAVGSAELITTGSDGYPRSTLLPVVWDGDTVIAHLARQNDHWQDIAPDAPALLVCTGPQAYVTPSWYAAKAEHGRVVPTWNYSTVHLRGTVRVHEDVDFVRRAVTLLTDLREGGRTEPWAVADAPGKFVDGQLRAIVGIELRVEQVDAKRKLSQNRSEEDRAGVVAGLAAGTPEESVVAAEMQRDLT